MAENKHIGDLTAATSITDNDLFAVEQGGEAKKVSGTVMKRYTLLDIISAAATTLASGASATASYDSNTKILTLGIPKGDKGDIGKGINSISKVGTSGLIDTYRITYTDSTTQDFTITNGAKGDKGDTGNGIDSIEKVGTSGLTDTYLILYDDGTNTTFNVTNGAKGDTGTSITSVAKTGTSGLVDTYTISFSDSTTTTFTVTNGEPGTNATVSSTQYGTSSSASVQPSSWSSSIPSVSAGNFLWTKINWNTGSTTVFASRYGMDGSGSVQKVHGVSPDSSGNVVFISVSNGTLNVG